MKTFLNIVWHDYYSLSLSLRRWKGKMQLNVFLSLLPLDYETPEVFIQIFIQSFFLSFIHQNYPTGFILQKKRSIPFRFDMENYP
ncbi:MAG: hypothetical protein COW85_05390 [Ignavibacteria bacterium CG22_combo_CG10-13_8_21_14_all_37_15]|nr:MAG: hypothetical protein COW85_05390 [Ignavibacteria bacterium CG22_combo_CG10-13_8_21_14_all_37_15]